MHATDEVGSRGWQRPGASSQFIRAPRCMAATGCFSAVLRRWLIPWWCCHTTVRSSLSWSGLARRWPFFGSLCCERWRCADCAPLSLDWRCCLPYPAWSWRWSDGEPLISTSARSSALYGSWQVVWPDVEWFVTCTRM